VSRSQAREHGAAPAPLAPAPPDALVAVIERRGRFLTAEPLFPRADTAREAPRGRGPGQPGRAERLMLGSRSSGGGIRANAGDLVLVQHARRGSGARILRRLGRPDIARDVIEGLMLDRGLSRGFDPAVEREARAGAERVGRGEGQRRDLRELATFTIDPSSARDFDDAISAEAIGEGGTAGIRVWVHIADVAAHVPEGSQLDREARRRATSVYVPGAVEPMLPHALSSDACSLRPGVERAAVTVELELHGASVRSAAFYRSLIRSDERLDYDRVDRIFAGQERAAEPWGEPLRAARRAAAALAREREQGGALVVDSAEPEFTFDQHGHVIDVKGRVQSESHRLIEHLMIAANEAVAALLAKRSVPCLYRVHERPEPARIERLVEQLAALEVPTPPLPEPLSSTQAAELLGAISRRVEDHLQRSGHGRAALGSLVLRSLKQAYYSPKNLGHAGLHSSAYCHFTSPIRRYPDIVCHRALLSAIGSGEREPRAGELTELGAWSSERERDAMTIERDADDVASCFALEKLLFQTGHDQGFAGEITGLISAGAFIAFGLPDRAPGGGEAQSGAPAPPFEGMLPVRSLHTAGRDGGREWWELDEQGTSLRGERTGATLRLGDPLEVRVARIEAIRGRVDLIPAG
jgi:ribonuclease R